MMWLRIPILFLTFILFSVFSDVHLAVTSTNAAIRVNAGGGEYTDGSGYLWSADYGYNTGKPRSTSDPVIGTTDDTLYQTERLDKTVSPELVYSFDVPNGDYMVNLYFAEINDKASFIGGRVFDVLIEDQLVLNNLDIYSEVWHDAALMKTFNVTVADGQLNIEFLHEIESPKISAIEVISQGTTDTEPPTIPTGLSGTPVSSTRIDLTWDPSTDTAGGSGLAGYRVYRDGTEVGTSTLTSYSDTGLNPDTLYTYTVSSYDNTGNESVQSALVGVTTQSDPDTEAPSVPTGLSGTPVSSTRIDLTWDPSTDTAGGSGLAGYRVYRDGTEVGTSTLTSYSDTGLNPDTLYTYTVSSYDNAGNESVQSALVGVTTQSDPDTEAPSVPTGLSGTPVSSTRIDLTWDPSTDTAGGSGLAGYRVYRDGTEVGTSTLTSYSDTGLNPDTLYTYTVSSYDNTGNESVQSALVGVTTQSDPDTEAPSVPTGLSGTPVSSTRIDLTWDPSTDTAGGSGLAGYRVYRDGTEVGTSTLTSYSDTGLNPDTLYTYTVSSYDNAGNESVQSALVGVTTQSDPDTEAPSVPTGLSGTPVSSTRIDLTWDPSTDTAGGSGLAGYRVYRDGTEVGTSTLTSYSDTGLNPDTLYTYTVSSYDNAGNESVQSALVGVTTQSDPDTEAPSVPTGLSGTPVSSTRIDLTWDPSTDTGGSGLAGYKIYRGGVEINTTTETNYSDTGLTSDTSYNYTVSAYDNAGNESVQSSFVDVTTLPVANALIRVNTGGGEYTDGSGYLWSADYGYNTGSLGSTSDPVSGTTDDTLYQTERWDKTVSPDLSYSFDVPNGDYTVNLYFAEIYDGASFISGRVFDVLIEGELVLDDLDIYSEVWHDAALMKTFNATVADGQLNIEFLHEIESPKISAIEVISQGTTDTEPPTIPTGLSGTPVSSTRIDLTWDPSTDTAGGSGLAGYRVYRDGTEVGTSTLTSYSDTGLNPDTLYTYTVSSYDNTGNESVQSALVGVTTQSDPDTEAPSVPTGLSGTPVSSTRIDLTWDPSTDTAGGSGLAGYRVYRDGTEVGTSTLTSYSDTGLNPDTLYTYTVSSYDNAGNESVQSALVGVTTQSDPDTEAPSVPTGLSGTPVSSTRIDLTWDPSTDTAGGSGLAGYRVYRDGTEVGTSTLTSYSDTGLNPDTLYTYTVSSYDNTGNESVQSALVGVTTQSDPDTEAPSVPTGLSGTPVSSTRIDLTWDPSTDTAGGSGLAGYRVYRDGTEVGTSTLTSYSDTGLNPDTLYTYTVSSYDNAGNESVQSALVGVTTQSDPDTEAPSVPTGLSGTPVSSTRIDLTWDPSTDTAGGSGLAGYKIYRGGVEINTTTETNYSDTGLTSDTSYNYTVSAYDNAGNESVQSSFVDVTTLPVANALIRVNTGGGEYTDGSGYLWSADYGYNTGSLGSTSDPVSGTTDDTLYQTERWDKTVSPDLAYSFDVPNGDYTVNLYFAEIYDGASFISGRVFDVLIEGELVLDDLDIYSEVWHDAALMKTFNATVADGQLNIEFLHEIESPKISAIEVISQGTTDTEPPTIPTGLSGTPVSSTRIDLTWDPSTDTAGGSGLAGYRVYRDGTEVGTSTLTSYSDTGLNPDTLYTYTVSSYDNAGNESVQSALVGVTTQSDPDTEAPSVPTGLSGTPVSSTRIDLTWDPSTDTAGGSGLAGYRVYRDGTEVGTSTLTSYSDTGLNPDTLYTYTVSSYDNAGNESVQSALVGVTTQSDPDTEAPSVPTGLSGTPVSSTQIDLTWNPSTDTGGSGLAGYKIYRGGVEINTTTETNYSDTGLTSDTSYNYTVSAYDNAGNESVQSSFVDVTTLPVANALIRVNTGGGEYTDGSGYLWSADYGYNTGSLGSTSDPVGGTTDDTLYQTERWDKTVSPDLSYSFDVPNGDYTVNLYFAEIYDGASFISGRVFDVLIEGELVLDDLDIYSEVWHDAALMKTFNATVADGQLNIEFLHGIESPKISAIEIISSSAFGLPFSDDFNDGTPDGWSVVDASMNASDWQVVSGEYNQHNNVEERDTGGIPFDGTYHHGTYAFLPLGATLTNYRFSVDATSLSEVGHDIGVMFRYWDKNNYYRLSLNSKYGFTRLEKRVAGNFVPLATNARGYQVGQPLNIVIEVKESLIKVYLNGDPLFSISDTSFSSGSIALYCQDSAKFDNIVVDYNSTEPSIVISSPIAHSIETTDTFTVSAVATKVPPSGGSIEFLLDGTIYGNPVPVSTDGLYSSECSNISQGDHTIEAILYESGSQVAIDTNERIGVLGNYLVAVGDSITNGLRDNFSQDNISDDQRIITLQGYEANLNNLLTITNGYPNIVFNDGIEGDESYDAAHTRIASVIERHPEADKILIILGTNDSQIPVLSGKGCSGSLCAGTFKENMQLLVDTIVSAGKVAVVGRVPPAFGSFPDGPFSDPLNTQRNQLIQDYNWVIENELTDTEVGPDFFSFFLSENVNRSSLFPDYVHPNGLGHSVIAHLWHNNITGVEILPFILEDIFPSTYKQNLLEVGDTYYVDETFTLTSIPSELEGGIWIMAENADKSNIQDNFLSFTVDRSVDVYVAYDPRATILPDWLNGFVYAGTLGVSDPGTSFLDLYRADGMNGIIDLGGNLSGGANGALSNYIVIVVAN